MKKNTIKKIVIYISTLLIFTVFIYKNQINLECNQVFTNLDDYVKYSQSQWEAAGYTVDNGSGTGTGTQVKDETSNNTEVTKAPVKTCEHEYEDRITKEPTCSEAGEMTSTCTKCGDTYTTVLSPSGKHEYESVVTKEATCTEAGEITYTCKMCGDTYTEEIPATGHEYTSSVTKAATCTVPGEQVYTCSKCGDTYTEEIPATGHVSGDWTITKEAGLFTPGERIIKCSVCGETLTLEAIPSRWPITYLYAAIVVGAVLVIGIIVIIILKKKRRI